MPTLPFWHFCPCASISKNLLDKLLIVEYYERPITHFCSKSVSGLVQGRPCTYLREQIELFKVKSKYAHFHTMIGRKGKAKDSLKS